MSYQLTATDVILRIADNTFIPPDPANIDYAAYLEWVAAGSTPAPAPELPTPPDPTAAEKLAAAGLTIDELNSMLGL